MEPVSANNAEQDDHSTTVPQPSVGKMLREARKRLGMSVADIADQTKLAHRQIESLEADDFRRLPEIPFVRGFVRSYARVLQLDEQPLLAALPQVKGGPVQLTPVSVEVPCDAGKTLWGHGVGMSASGALCMANQGQTWDQILKHFYTGIDLTKKWE